MIIGAEIPDFAIGGAAIGFFGWIIAQHFLVKKYIRDAAGIKETQQVDLTGQPIEVKKHTRPATVDELDAVKASIKELKEDVDQVSEKITKTKDALQLEGSRRSSQINSRVDGLAKEVTASTTAVEMTGNQVNRLDGKVDRILERLKA